MRIYAALLFLLAGLLLCDAQDATSPASEQAGLQDVDVDASSGQATSSSPFSTPSAAAAFAAANLGDESEGLGALEVDYNRIESILAMGQPSDVDELRDTVDEMKTIIYKLVMQATTEPPPAADPDAAEAAAAASADKDGHIAELSLRVQQLELMWAQEAQNAANANANAAAAATAAAAAAAAAEGSSAAEPAEHHHECSHWLGCGTCIAHGCGWCIASRKCVDDIAWICQGDVDHVGSAGVGKHTQVRVKGMNVVGVGVGFGVRARGFGLKARV